MRLYQEIISIYFILNPQNKPCPLTIHTYLQPKARIVHYFGSLDQNLNNLEFIARTNFYFNFPKFCLQCLSYIVVPQIAKKHLI